MVGRIIPSVCPTRIHLSTLRAVRVRLINTRQCAVHSREKVHKSASARDSHARRICLKFPRETRGPPRRRSRVAREQAADRESFVRRTRAVHVAATRLEQSPSFPLVKVSDYRKNVRTIFLCHRPASLLPHSPFFSLTENGLIDFYWVPRRTDACRFAFLMKANAAIRPSFLIRLPGIPRYIYIGESCELNRSIVKVISKAGHHSKRIMK